MSMFVWPDGTVTGSVNVVQLEEIQNAMKGVGKRKLAALTWPITSAAQLADTETEAEPEPEPEPEMVTVLAELAPEPKAKASTKKEKS